MFTPPTTPEELLQSWLRRAREAQWAHYETERSLLRVHYGIGVPLVLLTAFAGTSVFASISRQPATWFRVLVGLTSVLAAILSGLQTFLRTSDRASTHRSAAGSYGAIRRELETAIAVQQGSVTADLLTTISDRLDELASRSPAIPARVWLRVERTLAKR